MRKTVLTALALAAFVATAFGAVHVTATERSALCIPPAVIQAWS